MKVRAGLFLLVVPVVCAGLGFLITASALWPVGSLLPAIPPEVLLAAPAVCGVLGLITGILWALAIVRQK